MHTYILRNNTNMIHSVNSLGLSNPPLDALGFLNNALPLLDALRFFKFSLDNFDKVV